MTASVRVLRVRDGQRTEAGDTVVREQTVALVIGGREFLRLQCLPVGIEDLAIGLLVTSGLLFPGAPVPPVEFRADRSEIQVALDVPEAALADLRSRLTLGSGCGFALSPTPGSGCSPQIDPSFRTTPDAISQAMDELMTRSELFRDTGAVHSAGICLAANARNDECRTPDEAPDSARSSIRHSSFRHSSLLLAFAEDIGRHNAFDKVVGACRRQGIELTDKIALVTGRLSQELVAKAVPAGLPVLVSRGAPTDAAVRIAHRSSLTLVGFARAGRMNIYTAPWRIA